MIATFARPIAATRKGPVAAVGNRLLPAQTGCEGITVDALPLGTMNYWDSEELAKKTCIAPDVRPPQDGGAGVAYFASREASGITGQVLPLNGGSLTACPRN